MREGVKSCLWFLKHCILGSPMSVLISLHSGGKRRCFLSLLFPGHPHGGLPGRELILGTCPSSWPLELWFLAQGSGVLATAR